MFPAGLYSLTPRDIVGVPVELILRSGSVTADGSLFGNLALYVVPAGKVLVLLAAGLTGFPDPLGAIIRTGHLTILSPETPSTQRFGMQGPPQSIAGLPQVLYSFSGPILVPPLATVQVGWSVDIIGFSNSYTMSFNGYQIPLGTINPRG